MGRICLTRREIILDGSGAPSLAHRVRQIRSHQPLSTWVPTWSFLRSRCLLFNLAKDITTPAWHLPNTSR